MTLLVVAGEGHECMTLLVGHSLEQERGMSA